ncbi:MAG TPA: helix-turn-helix transcriptional regulator [Syntrophomonadaceae bacterium]|nr:helix-turn-helix transcriptional regulator [Syntrophomonadaceae bacterium]
MIIVRLDRVMADRKISLLELAEKIGISNVNLSKLKTGKVKGIRFGTMNMLCNILNCQPGDLFEFLPDNDDENDIQI